MKEYDVTITETLQRTVTVEAASQMEAELAVQESWNNQDYVLGAEDFVDAQFNMTAEREIQHKKTMDALLVRPGAYPEKVSIGMELEDLQEAVGGDIEATYPYDDPVALVMNESGKFNGMPLNRALRTDDGDLYDIVAGDFLVVGLTEDDFGSLSPELMEKYEKQFHQPESFIRMGRGIMAIPLPDDMVQKNAEKAARAPEGKQKQASGRDAL